MTADLKLRFRHEVPVGRGLIARGAVLWQRRTILAIEATLLTEDDSTLLASAAGKFVSRGAVEPGTRLGFVGG